MEELDGYQESQAKRGALVHKYATKGIKIHADWNGGIDSVYIRELLTDEEFMIIMTDEGYPSEIRGLIANCLAIEEGYLSCDDLMNIYYEMEEMDVEEDDPVLKISSLWSQIEDDAKLENDLSKANPNNLQDAIKLVWNSCSMLVWGRMMNRRPISDDNKFEWDKTNIDETSALISAIGTIYRHCHELNPPPVEGYAICRGDDVVTHDHKPSVHYSKGKAEIIISMWDKHDKGCLSKNEQRTPQEPYTIRPVRISLERGMEFIEATEEMESRQWPPQAEDDSRIIF